MVSAKTMTLDDWLKRQGESPEWLADKIGVGRPAVTRYLNGSRRPEWDVIERITRVTNGAVTANDFLKIRRKVRRPRKNPAKALEASL